MHFPERNLLYFDQIVTELNIPQGPNDNNL